jgi:hypothetical protein
MSHSGQRPRAPDCDFRRYPALPSKSGNASPLIEGRKEIISTTTRTLQGVTSPANPSLRKTAGAPREKIQNPNYRCTRI